MAPRTTLPQTTLTLQEQELWSQWQARVARHQAGQADALPPEVAGIGGMRVFGRSGDAVVAFPRVRHLSDLELLPADVQFALELANRTIAAHRAAGGGRMIFATTPAVEGRLPEPEPILRIDPTKHADILIVAPIAGGAR